MKFHRSHREAVQSLAGAILLAPWFFLLLGHLSATAAYVNRLSAPSDHTGMNLLSTIVLAASFNSQNLLHVALTILWPLIVIAAGTDLLWIAASASAVANVPCPGCA